MPQLPPNLTQTLPPLAGHALYITRKNRPAGEQLAQSTPSLRWTLLTKDDMRGWTSRRLLKELRKHAYAAVVLEDSAQDLTRRRDLYRGMLLIARAKHRFLLGSHTDHVTAEPVHRGHLLPWLGSLIADAIATALAVFRGYRRTRKPKGLTTHLWTPAPEGARIALLRTEFWFDLKAGGSVSHALGVLGGMKNLGLQTHLWTTSLLPNPNADPNQQLQQTLVQPAKRPAILEEAAMAAFDQTYVDQVLPRLKQYKPHLIYQRHAAFTTAGVHLARQLNVPLVLEVNASEVWAREAWSRLYFAGLARAMERFTFSHADRLILISDELIPVVTAMGGDPKKIVVNPNGVDVTRFNPDNKAEQARQEMNLPPNAILAGFIGTFTRWHGVLFLAEQVAQAVQQNPNLHFLFIGDGDLRPDVERTLAEHGVAAHARFTGLVDPSWVPDFLAACDILLSPHLPFEDGTEFFGSPTKLFEYLAAGRPVVASNLGQIGRVVEDGQTGFLFPPGDGPGFQAALQRLAQDPERREAMGRRARAVAEGRYTWTANAARALDGFIETVETHSPTP